MQKNFLIRGILLTTIMCPSVYADNNVTPDTSTNIPTIATPSDFNNTPPATATAAPASSSSAGAGTEGKGCKKIVNACTQSGLPPDTSDPTGMRSPCFLAIMAAPPGQKLTGTDLSPTDIADCNQEMNQATSTQVPPPKQ
jgi:hypothetical protein